MPLLAQRVYAGFPALTFARAYMHAGASHTGRSPTLNDIAPFSPQTGQGKFAGWRGCARLARMLSMRSRCAISAAVIIGHTPTTD
jgi:hypothetical protein